MNRFESCRKITKLIYIRSLIIQKKAPNRTARGFSIGCEVGSFYGNRSISVKIEWINFSANKQQNWDTSKLKVLRGAFEDINRNRGAKFAI